LANIYRHGRVRTRREIINRNDKEETGYGGQEENSTLRLLMPQWQGGGNNFAYALGAQLLAWLAPASTAAFEEVPINRRTEGLAVDRGIFAREVVLE
jgi:hypothetical protein